MKTILYHTKTHNPWLNLAREEYLFNSISQNNISHIIFYLWQNQNTIVIGKNQNPWKECQIPLLEKENVYLARRISGGGAVFHDLGNLNFTFIIPKEMYDLSRQLKVILNAMQSLGIPAEFKGRNDLVVQDRKFSGNAFCYQSKQALHHGTILVSADLEKLTRYLQVSQDKIKSKGVSSVRSRVINLNEFVPGLTIQTVEQALNDSFQKEYGGYSEKYFDDAQFDAEVLQKLYQRYASWEWRFGNAPKFDITLDTRFSWGGIELGLSLNDAKVVKCEIFSDAMDELFISTIPSILHGSNFSSKEMGQRIRDFFWDITQIEQAKEIADWLEKQKF